jgi:hypothetical protein
MRRKSALGVFGVGLVAMAPSVWGCSAGDQDTPPALDLAATSRDPVNEVESKFISDYKGGMAEMITVVSKCSRKDAKGVRSLDEACAEQTVRELEANPALGEQSVQVKDVGVSSILAAIKRLSLAAACDSLKAVLDNGNIFYYQGVTVEGAVGAGGHVGIEEVFDLYQQQAAMFGHGGLGIGNQIGASASGYAGFAAELRDKDRSVTEAWAGETVSLGGGWSVPFTRIGAGFDSWINKEGNIVGAAGRVSVGLNVANEEAVGFEGGISYNGYVAWDWGTTNLILGSSLGQVMFDRNKSKYIQFVDTRWANHNKVFFAVVGLSNGFGSWTAAAAAYGIGLFRELGGYDAVCGRVAQIEPQPGGGASSSGGSSSGGSSSGGVGDDCSTTASLSLGGVAPRACTSLDDDFMSLMADFDPDSVTALPDTSDDPQSCSINDTSFLGTATSADDDEDAATSKATTNANQDAKAKCEGSAGTLCPKVTADPPTTTLTHCEDRGLGAPDGRYLCTVTASVGCHYAAP